MIVRRAIVFYLMKYKSQMDNKFWVDSSNGFDKMEQLLRM